MGELHLSLQVSEPHVPYQLSTYFLQLPYSYAVPMMVAMATLHWLVSQSPFAVQIAVVDNNGPTMPDRQMATCEYSAIALIFVLTVGGLMIIALLVSAFWKLTYKSPVVSFCNAAISAACHPGDQEGERLSELPLMWGVVGSCDDVGHASFRRDFFTSNHFMRQSM
jgi:hypothetical protein